MPRVDRGLILLLQLPLAGAVACSALQPGALLFNASLARCQQRCRDAVSGCSYLAYNSASSLCSLAATSAADGGCGSGWASQARPTSCGYGQGLSSSVCQACGLGTASHPDLGDLVGAWALTDLSTQASLGILSVQNGGQAAFPDGTTGQFVLWQPRPDPNYPGAFYAERRGLGGQGTSWDYAWIQDSPTTGIPNLVIRRFCGAGPVSCPGSTSPEGSGLFNRTLLGVRTSGAEPPCALLEGPQLVPLGATAGPCCSAATAAAAAATSQTATTTTLTADLVVPGVSSWMNLALVSGTWNTASLSLLQGASLVMRSTDPMLCTRNAPGLGVSPTVVFAVRGGCSFTDKALAAVDAGAIGLIVGNVAGSSMPDFLTLVGSTVPTVPTWMIADGPASAITSALNGKTGTVQRLGPPLPANLSTLQVLCCDSRCQARATAAVAGGLAAFNISATCSSITCTGFSPSPPATPTPILPGASGSCSSCPSGMVAVTPGLPNCGACPDGQVGNLNGTACLAAITTTTTTPPAALSPSPSAGSVGSGSAALTQQAAAQASGGSSSTSSSSGSSFPWGAVIAIVVIVILIVLGIFAVRRWYRVTGAEVPEGTLGRCLTFIGVDSTPKEPAGDEDEEAKPKADGKEGKDEKAGPKASSAAGSKDKDPKAAPKGGETAKAKADPPAAKAKSLPAAPKSSGAPKAAAKAGSRSDDAAV